jgi:hypothetical protein
MINFGASTSRDESDVINLISDDEEDVKIDDGKVDPDTVALFENADDVREYVEDIVADRAKEKGILYKLAAEGDRRCLVKACGFIAHNQPAARGFCAFHSSVGNLCLGLVNGRICTTEGCENKSQIYENLCGSCYKPDAECKRKIEREKLEKGKQWTNEKVQREANDIATKYADMVKKDPTLLVYFGITIRSLQIRLKEHLKSGKDFEMAVTIRVIM